MKRNVIATLSLVALALLLNATAAFAQAAAKADVPFAFTVGKVELPAATYVVSNDTAATVTIRNAETRKAILSLMHREYPKGGSPRLVFHKVGGQYFLAQIWGEEGNAGMSIPISALEKELVAGNTSTPEVVVIAMK
ncbi:MAG TPA: hypothetical protein VGF06_18770 [Terriglobales bacterium]|jgi:hypothetical protein